LLTFCITLLETHNYTHTQLDTKYYKPTIRQIKFDTQTNRKTQSFNSYEIAIGQI